MSAPEPDRAENERVLNAYVRQYGRLERTHDTPELRAEIAAARAAVLARMQPQGEVYEVEACDAHGVTADAIVCFRRDEFAPGQRVRVVRVAE